MADQPERNAHLRITRSSIIVQDPHTETPRRFVRDIDCGSGAASAADDADGRASKARGEGMPSRYGEENGRRHR
jgi:hypothetical protein